VRLTFASRIRRAASDEAVASYSTAKLPGARTPWRQARWCALDFELTGLDPREDEIVSFGAIPIDAGRVQLRDAVSGLVRPVRESSEVSVRVHGIRTADLARAPLIADAVAPLLRTISGRVLVAHSAAVERAFLGRAVKGRGVRLRAYGSVVRWSTRRCSGACGCISVTAASAAGLHLESWHTPWAYRRTARTMHSRTR
jgi:DNA polymerase III epsilon subunit-like protein